MTSFTPSRGDVAPNKSGLVPLLCSFATQRDLVLGHLDVPWFVSACLDGVLLRLLPALAHGDLFIHRVLLYVQIFLFSRLPNQDWIQPFYFGIVPVLSLSDRIQLLHNLSTRPRLFSILGRDGAEYRLSPSQKICLGTNDEMYLHKSSQYYVTRTGAASTWKTCTVTATTTT